MDPKERAAHIQQIAALATAQEQGDFDSEDEAIELANDTPYGLAAYIQTGSTDRARRVASKLRAGMIQVNGAHRASGMPFGGFKQSGVGREGGGFGIDEFLEVKSVSGIVEAG